MTCQSCGGPVEYAGVGRPPARCPGCKGSLRQERQRSYYLTNRERVLARMRERYREQHPVPFVPMTENERREANRRANREWRERHPERVIAQSRAQHEKRATPGLRRRANAASRTRQAISLPDATRRALPWSREEEALMLQMVGQGRTSIQIAHLLGRTLDAVIRRRSLVGRGISRPAA